MDTLEQIRSISEQLTLLQKEIPVYHREFFNLYVIPQSIGDRMSSLIHELEKLTAEGQTE
jgi:conjugal transfer/entry exclusion protein